VVRLIRSAISITSGAAATSSQAIGPV
jgi:hypothetical protein